MSLGSSGDSRLLGPLLEAIEWLPVTAALATAGRSSGSVPSNVFTADYLPALKVIDRARLVVSNGGSPAAYQALSRGVPLLGLPSNADQYLMMESVAREGAGVLVRAGAATPRRIRAAIERVLADDRFREAATGLQAEMPPQRAEGRFIAFVEGVASAG